MKKQQALELYEGLKTLNLKGLKLNYILLKNKAKLEKEIELIQELIKASKGFIEYDTKRIELAKKYAKTDKNGEVKVDGNRILIENEELFLEELKELQEEFADAIKERDAQLQDYIKLLDEEFTGELEKVDVEYLPEDISTKELDILFPILN